MIGFLQSLPNGFVRACRQSKAKETEVLPRELDSGLRIFELSLRGSHCAQSSESLLSDAGAGRTGVRPVAGAGLPFAAALSASIVDTRSVSRLIVRADLQFTHLMVHSSFAPYYGFEKDKKKQKQKIGSQQKYNLT